MSYHKFLIGKTQFNEGKGFKPLWIPDALFDFQKALVEWSIVMGRSATFADCGLGKTAMLLSWAENVARKENGKVLILTPLAVGPQFVIEGEKFGVECAQSKDGKHQSKIVVANYERLHLFNSGDFVATACDESSILKNFDGVTKARVTEFMRGMRYRWLGTATPAPNDFIELGTSAEALCEMVYMDMLTRFFKNDQNSSHPNRILGNANWRFRGHAERDFWRWVASWGRAVRKPSDLGFQDGDFVLPPLEHRLRVVASKVRPEGFLFDLPAGTLEEQREDRRRTLEPRCEKAAELANARPDQSLVWCHLNPEGNLLEKLITGAVQVAGSDSIDRKEEVLEAFRRGAINKLVSKPGICGHGLNFQGCAHQTFFPDHSFEQRYQAIRRSWRFGQKRKVTIDTIVSEGQMKVLENLERKEAAADVMFARLVKLVNQGLHIPKNNRKEWKIQRPSFL